MRTFRFRNYAFPLRILRARRLMLQAPGWSRERLDAWSRERRRRLVRFAMETVPYYREVFQRAGVRPDEVGEPEVWLAVPTVDRAEMQADPRRFMSSAVRVPERYWAHTSGSSGRPARFLLDPDVSAAAVALFWRAWSSGGHWFPGRRQAALKRTDAPEGWEFNRVIRTLRMSSVRVSPETAPVFAEQIRRYRPRFIRGYPSSLYLLCRLLREQGIRLKVPMVVSGSETLHDFHRREIESFFGARLYDHYTHWERSVSVLECEHGSMHAQEDFGHHEILDHEGRPVPPGVPGEVVGTGLHHRGMPFIRYRTGDVAIWAEDECPCGQSFPVIEKIVGRTSDFLVKADGSLLGPTAVRPDVHQVDNILYTQLVQERAGEIELRIVPAPGFRDPEDTHPLVAQMRDRLGEDTRISIRVCRLEELERNPVGKVRACFSRLHPFGSAVPHAALATASPNEVVA